MSFFSEIKKRKLLNTLALYMGASWAAIEALSFFIERYYWNDAVFSYAVTIIGFGLPGTLVYQWFRWNDTDDKIQRVEVIIQSMLIMCACYFLYNVDSSSVNNERKDTSVIENSIAVLPFQNLGANKEADFYGDGFADDVITTLSKNSNFMVISRTSSFQFRDTNRSVKVIRDQLRVSTILEGSYRVFDNQIRLNVNLVQTDSEENLWSETFTGLVSDIFSLQSRVAEEIAKSLQMELNPSKIQQNVDVLAYEYYRKGSDLIRQKYISKKTLDESVEALKKAEAIDSTFSKVHTTLAEVYIGYLYWGYDEYENVAANALEYIQKARKNNADEGDIYGLLSGLSHFNYQWEASKKYSEQAKAHNPNSPFVYWVDMKNAIVDGNKGNALNSLNMLMNLDPLTSTNLTYQGWILGYFRDYDKSIAFLKNRLENSPEDNFTLWGLAYVYSLKGDYKAAIETFMSRKVATNNQNWALGYALGRAGKIDKAKKVAEYLIDKKENKSFVPAYMIGYVYLGMNDLDNAFLWFDKAYEERIGWLVQIRYNPAFDEIREDSRYLDLMKKVNLD